MLPFVAMQRVRTPCPHCGHENVRLAAAVKKGVSVRCQRCRRAFRVVEVHAVVGTSASTR
jgi:transposase-like protein